MNDWAIAATTGLSLGILASFHCIGMCGPIALSLPVHQLSSTKKLSAVFLYNFGRAVAYAVLGLIFGLIGLQFQIWGLQQIVSVVAGILILITLFSNYSIASKVKWLARFNALVKTALGRFLKKPKTPETFFAIGFLNGLLPCGLVYVAIGTALVTGAVSSAIMLMFSFGMGTLPTMATLMFLGNIISLNMKQKLNRLVPFFIGTMACLLILRGMNLNIPFISPVMNNHSTGTVQHCKSL